jgi:hypothetical protein
MGKRDRLERAVIAFDNARMELLRTTQAIGEEALTQANYQKAIIHDGEVYGQGGFRFMLNPGANQLWLGFISADSVPLYLDEQLIDSWLRILTPLLVRKFHVAAESLSGQYIILTIVR